MDSLVFDSFTILQIGELCARSALANAGGYWSTLGLLVYTRATDLHWATTRLGARGGS